MHNTKRVFQHPTYPLIGEDDAPPYTIINPEGKADLLIVGDR